MHRLGEAIRHLPDPSIEHLHQKLINLRALDPQLTKLGRSEQPNLGRTDRDNGRAAGSLCQQGLFTHNIALVHNIEAHSRAIDGQGLDKNSTLFEQVHAIGSVAFATEHRIGVV